MSSPLRTISFDTSSSDTESDDLPTVAVKGRPVRRATLQRGSPPPSKLTPRRISFDFESSDSGQNHEIITRSPLESGFDDDITHETPNCTLQESPKPKKNTLRTYRCHRSSSLLGKCIVFHFYHGDEVIYSAKGKHFRLTSIAIQKGPEVHLKDTECYANIEVQPDKSKYILRKKTTDGPEMVSLTITAPEPRTERPRHVIANVTVAPGRQVRLHNLKPTFNRAKQTWQLDFNGRYVITSVKNCILVDDNDIKHIVVRKTTKEDLEIDCVSSVDPLVLFAITIGSFLSP